MTATPGGYLKLYVNGVDATGPSYGGTLPNPLPNTPNPIQIGGGTWLSNYFAGKIPVTKIYNRVLTAGEILQNYNTTIINNTNSINKEVLMKRMIQKS